jgi:putative SOS response-associated peptidase YedK
MNGNVEVKRPFYIRSAQNEVLMFAGIWEVWRGNGEAVTSCAIITTPPNDLVAELHDRMPAILSPEGYSDWLDPRTDSRVLSRMLLPYPAADMEMYPVGFGVNSPDNDSSDLLEPEDRGVGQTMSLF